MNENKNTTKNWGNEENNIINDKMCPKTIITTTNLGGFVIEDWTKSGISAETINKYIEFGYLTENSKSWSLYYPELYKNIKSDYYTQRIKDPKNGKKYIRPAGKCSKLFRPLELSPNILKTSNEYIIITEGEKKSIKAVQEGLNCLSLGGVWNWKKRLQEDITSDDDKFCDIIPDIATANLKDRVVYLCYDNDLWQKEQVKNALYQFSAYLISEKKANVKIINLPVSNEKIALDDFLIKYGKNEFQKLIDNAKSIKLPEIQMTLTGNIADNKKFPIEIFDNNLSILLKELHLRHDAPLEYIGSLFIAFTSVVMLGKYKIIVDKSCNWIDNPIIWLAIVGNPSQKKTPVLNIFKKIIDDFEQELNKKFEIDMQNYTKQVQEYKKSSKQFEIGKSSEIPQEPKEPLKQRLTTQNTTVEALIKAVSKNEKGIERGISIVVDELTNFLKSFGQYKGGVGNDLDYYLQAWKAQITNTIRQNSNTDYTTCVYHSIIGTIQPKILDDTIFSDGLDSSNGMKERWLFATSKYEETGEKYKGDKSYNIEPIKTVFSKLYRYNDEPKFFEFSSEAQKIFDDFCKTIVIRKKASNLSDLMKNYLQKQTDYVARFALILHCIKAPDVSIIDKITVINAIKLSSYFIACFEDIILQKFNSIPLSDYALNYIRTRGLKKISPTTLYKSNISKYKNSQNALIALEHLSNRGYGRLIKSSNGGAIFIVYY